MLCNESFNEVKQRLALAFRSKTPGSAIAPKETEKYPTDGDLVRRFSRRAEDLDEYMPPIYMPTPSPINLKARTFAFGYFGKLPVEILDPILHSLDLQTLTRLMQTCFSGLSAVQSMPAYRGLLEHAPSAIAALSQTELLHVHSLAQLWEVLISDRCACCTYYGPYLFLPTCARACWECLKVNPSLRVLTFGEAAGYFSLKKTEVRQLPILRTIPHSYRFCKVNRDSPPSQLVSAAAANELGIRVHGSSEVLEDILLRNYKSETIRDLGKFYQKAYLTPLRDEFLPKPIPRGATEKDYIGMASTPFPYLRASGEIETGIWCSACDTVAEMHHISWYSPINWPQPPHEVRLLSRRARSKEEFMDHMKSCLGVKKIIDPASNKDYFI